MHIKNSIIFIPGWWPCSFFEEQQATYADSYEIYNLYGTCEWLAKKKQLRQLLSFCSVNQLSAHIEGACIKVKVRCAKYNSESRWAHAITQMSECIGQLILSQTGGNMPSLIYIQSISDIAIFVAEWAKRNGIKILLAEHILYIRHDTSYISKRKEQLYSIADQVFCVSNYLYRNLLTNGFNMQKVRVIGNLINEHAVPKDWNAIKKNGRIMFVAGHVADKDMHTLFAVAKHLQKHSLLVDIYGLTGQELMEGKPLSEYSTKNIMFKGNMPHNELLMQYSAYSLLLSTSISETFGLAVAEAIAHGTPVVCTDSGGIREFVNERNSKVVGIADVRAIEEAVLDVLSTTYDCKAMSLEILAKYGAYAYRNNSKLI